MWLTEVIRESGALAAERVVSVETEPLPAFTSLPVRATVQYDSAETSGRSFILVTLAHPNPSQKRWAQPFYRREVRFLLRWA